MKFISKRGKGRRVVSVDGNRKNRLSSTLLKASEKKRRQELVNDGKAPSKPTTKLTIKTNRAGNLRGTKSALDPERARKIRAMRKIYNKMVPQPQCNGCAYAQSCPQFQAGYECAFLPLLNSHAIESIDDIRDYLKELLGANVRRLHLSSIMETLGGGKPDLELSEQYALLYGQLKDLHAIESEANLTEISLETDDDSIIGKLFGNLDNLVGETNRALSAPIEVPALDVRNGEDADTLRDKGVNTEVLNDFTQIGLEVDAKRKKAAQPVGKIISATLSHD